MHILSENLRSSFRRTSSVRLHCGSRFSSQAALSYKNSIEEEA